MIDETLLKTEQMVNVNRYIIEMYCKKLKYNYTF